MRRVLHAAWQLPAAAGAPAHVWRDGVLLGLLVALAVVETILRPDLPWRWATLAVELAVLPTLLWRRIRPGLMTAIAFGVLFVWDAIRVGAGVGATQSYVLIGLLILVYALARWGSGRAIALGGATVLASMIRSFASTPGDLQNTVGGIAVVAVCVTLGVIFRVTDSARRQRLEQVRLEERARLARDLHDTVAHHVSAIAVRAQAGILTGAADPSSASAFDALRVIEHEAGQTLREMRAMVGMLREGDLGPLAPIPALSDLAALAEAPVSLEMNGDPGVVPPAVGAAAYRIVQEAITNSRRHARGATRIAVTVTIGAAEVGIRVADDGRGGGARGQGFGLAGMRERAALLGGWCEAGPTAGGWIVEARLPFGADR